MLAMTDKNKKEIEPLDIRSLEYTITVSYR